MLSKFQDINGLDVAPLNVSNDWESSENNSKKFYNLIKKKNLKVNAIQGIFYKKNFSLLDDFVKNDNSVISHFREVDRHHKQFSMDISGTEFHFILDEKDKL